MIRLIDRIDILLEKRGLTYEQASLKAGLHKDTLRDLKRGKRQSTTDLRIVALAKALNTSPNWLLGFEEGFQNAAQACAAKVA